MDMSDFAYCRAFWTEPSSKRGAVAIREEQTLTVVSGTLPRDASDSLRRSFLA
jgi:hypothetical protein